MAGAQATHLQLFELGGVPAQEAADKFVGRLHSAGDIEGRSRGRSRSRGCLGALVRCTTAGSRGSGCQCFA
jgi:hypothetical protein